VRVELGKAYLAEHTYSEAIEQGMLALQSLPGYAEAALLVAEAENERGNAPAAIAVLADLLADDPYHLSILLKLGEILLEHGHPQDAIVAFRRVLRFDPKQATAWLRLAQTYRSLNDVELTEASRQRAIEAGMDAKEVNRSVGPPVKHHYRHESPARSMA
jgi:predicted Zn-dependent protease